MSDKNPLSGLCNVWCQVIKKAEEHKDEAFGKAARECWKFFDQVHDFMYKKDAGSLGVSVSEEIETKFRVTFNKVAEFVQIYGPALYFTNPYRQANPRIPDVPDLVFQLATQPPPPPPGTPGMDPNTLAAWQQQQQQMLQQQLSQQASQKRAIGSLLETYLNYLPNELGLREHSRRAIDEALIKGRGLLWHEMYAPPDSTFMMPRSYFVSVDELGLDPDAEDLEDALFVYRKRCQPYYLVEERFGLERGSLKKFAKGESVATQAIVASDDKHEFARKRGEAHDLFTYYEIWSKCGMGQYLKNTPSASNLSTDIDRLRDSLDQFGRYCYLAVSDGVQYPLNLPPEVMELDVTEGTPEGEQNLQEVMGRLKWPIPFYLDAGTNSWPFTELDFHQVPRSAWPMAHMKAGIGELKAINWILSFLMGHIRVTSRTFIGVLEALDDETKKSIQDGPDLTIIPLRGILGKQITDVISFLQHPDVISDMWTLLEKLMEIFDKRVGLTELMYGQTEAQMRSAAEADVKSSQINIRPGDMAECTETWQSRIARKEAFMTRLFIGPEHAAPVFGEAFDPNAMQIGPLTRVWQQFVYRPSQDPAEIANIIREFDYRIEAGSIRKPNRSRDQANMNQVMQTVFPDVFAWFQATGDPSQLNALLKEWARSYDIDVEACGLQFSPPPPPPAGQSPAPAAAAK